MLLNWLPFNGTYCYSKLRVSFDCRVTFRIMEGKAVLVGAMGGPDECRASESSRFRAWERRLLLSRRVQSGIMVILITGEVDKGRLDLRGILFCG